jgi:hypothetical protein
VIENDTKKYHHGIYVLNTNNPALQSALERLNRYMADPAQKDATPYTPGIEIPMDDFIAIQHQNLNNVIVSKALFKTPPFLSETDEYNGILHYKQITLSDIISAFGQFGITHVNVLDRSCRVFDVPKSISLARQQSQTERRKGEQYEKGGKRSKNKRNKKTRMKRMRTTRNKRYPR